MFGVMTRFLAPLVALAMPLHVAWAAPSTNLQQGLDLIRTETDRNLKRGAKFVHMAAVAGETQAEYVMGLLFLKGKGTSRSPKRAVRWFRQAAEKDHVKAQLALGKLLGRSRNTELRKEAWRWLEAAHRQGAPAAKKLLAELADGRIGDSSVPSAEETVTPEVTVINMGRGTPATPEELAALRERDRRLAQEAEARRKQVAERAAAQREAAAKSRQAQEEAAAKRAEALRREAVDRAARRAAGLPELPRGQLSPHLEDSD